MNNKLIILSIFISILLLSLLLYFQGLNGPFILDDFHNIQSTIISDNTFEQWYQLAFGDYSGHPGRPVSRLSFALNGWLFGLESFSFKLVNVFLHGLTSFLIFILAIQLLKLTEIDQSNIVKIAILSSLIWLIHPLHVSTVLYIVQRMTILSAFFSLLAVITYIKERTTLSNKPVAIKKYILACMLVILLWLPLAYASKENGVLLLGYLFFIEWAFFYKSDKEKLLLSWLGVILFTVLIATFFLKINSIIANYSIRGFNLTERLLTQSQVLWLYLYQITWPNEANMALYHDAFTIVRSLNIKTILAIVGHCLLIGGAILIKKKQPIIFLGVAWFYTGHLIESTIIPLEMIFEHRNYLPLFGPVLIFSYYFIFLIQKLSKTIQIIIIAALLIGVSMQTFLRVLDWRTDLILMTSMVKKQPDSIRAHSDLASALIARNRIAEAKQTLYWVVLQYPEHIDMLLQYNSLFCKNELLANNIKQQTIQQLSTFNKPESITYSLFTLVKIYRDNNCNNAQAYIMDYIDAYIANPEVKKRGDITSISYLMKAGVYAKQKNIELATLFFEKSYQTDKSKTSYKVLLQQAEFYLSLDLVAETKQVVNKIKDKHLSHSSLKENKIQSNDFNLRYNKITQYLNKKQ